MTPPAVGSQVTMIDKAGFISSTTTYGYYGIVVASSDRFQKKGAAMRNITIENITLIEDQGNH